MKCLVCQSQTSKLLYLGNRPTATNMYYCEMCFHVQVGGYTNELTTVVVDGDSLSFTNNPKQTLKDFKKHGGDSIVVKCLNTNIIYDSLYTFQNGQISFFSTNSMKLLCDKCGLYLNKVFETSEGMFYEISTTETQKTNVIDTLVNEMEKGLYSKHTYNRYMYRYMIYKNTLHNLILYEMYKNENADYSSLCEYFGISLTLV